MKLKLPCCYFDGGWYVKPQYLYHDSGIIFQIGEGVSDMTEVVRCDQPVMSTALLRSSSRFLQEFRRYSQFFSDFLAIGGFEYCSRTGRCVLLTTCALLNGIK